MGEKKHQSSFKMRVFFLLGFKPMWRNLIFVAHCSTFSSKQAFLMNTRLPENNTAFVILTFFSVKSTSQSKEKVHKEVCTNCGHGWIAAGHIHNAFSSQGWIWADLTHAQSDLFPFSVIFCVGGGGWMVRRTNSNPFFHYHYCQLGPSNFVEYWIFLCDCIPIV